MAQHKRASQSSSNKEKLRTATDADMFVGGSQQVNYDSEGDYPMHKAQLYQLFTLIEKEFDRLYTENISLRARIGIETGTDSGNVHVETSDVPKQVRKAMQMGQKLRTALGKRPQGRLVFKVGGTVNQRFKLNESLEGHRDGIWHIATCSSIVASASADHTSRVWSLDTCECIGVYSGHTGSVNCVSFSPNSDCTNEVTVATASGDESVHVWKIAIGCQSDRSQKEERREEEETVSVDNDSIRRISSPLIRLTGHCGVVSSCQWLSSSTHLVSASWDRTANVYDVERAEVVNVLTGHEQELTSSSCHPWQKMIVTGSNDCTFRLWDLREPMQSVAVLQGHNDSVTSVDFSSTDRIVSASDDRTLKVWDIRNMRCAHAVIRLNSTPNNVCVGRMNNLVAIPLDNSHVTVADLNGQRLLHRRCHSGMVTGTAWTDSSTLITCSFDRLIMSWKLNIPKDKDDKT